MRGFLVLSLAQDADIQDSQGWVEHAWLGESEASVMAEFQAAYQDLQVMGIVCLEDIRRHERLILDLARVRGIALS